MADGMLSLAWNNHSSTFTHMLSTVRDAALYTDVTIACDGKFYPAHKLVLSTCSDYFHKIFERTPCKHPVIVIKDVECKNMEALLNYMYAGVVNVSQNDLAQLIRAAELLEIKGLAVPDEPPSGTKRPVQTHDTSADSNSSNPKKSRQEEKRTSNQAEVPSVDSLVPSSQFSSKNDDSVGEQISNYNVYNNKVNQRQSHSEHMLERKESPTCSRRSEELDTTNEQDQLNPAGHNQDELASGSRIKEEKVEPEDESESAEMGFEYESLVTDLVGIGGETKEQCIVSDPSFNHSLDTEAYSGEAGPSGLQPWPAVGEGGEASAVSQGYSGTLPLPSHPGQQPHQIQHMVGSQSECRWLRHDPAQEPSFSLVLKDNKNQHFTKVLNKNQHRVVHQCPFCSYKTGFRHNLTKHVRIHTGEKPYVCSFCPFRANQNISLKRHMLKLHNEAACGQERVQARMQEAPQV